MRVAAETREAGPDEAVFLCTVPAGGVLVKNTGGTRVYLGGPDVEASGAKAGYPLDPGESQVFTAGTGHESPVVPAPPDDLSQAQLYGRTGAAAGTALVAWITAG